MRADHPDHNREPHRAALLASPAQPGKTCTANRGRALARQALGFSGKGAALRGMDAQTRPGTAVLWCPLEQGDPKRHPQRSSGEHPLCMAR